MSNTKDTIAAISTAPGEAGIAIIRISGNKSLEIADKIFLSPSKKKPSLLPANSFAYGHIVDSQGNIIDEAIVLVFRRNHSYTREDVGRIQCHGGRISSKKILTAVIEAGARLAEPGEFTKRAFLNGRLDLIQAEAVIDLIRAQSDLSARLAMEQLEGNVSYCLRMIYDKTLALCADIEASLDFDEDEVPEILSANIVTPLREIITEVEELIKTWDEGRIIREGVLVAIAGKPNVGKSTLLNSLLGYERAIVSEIPGTTRDLIEEQCIIDGIVFRFVDTAGIRESECKIEREGVNRTKNILKRADLILYVAEAPYPLSSDDLALISDFKNKCAIVMNKTDLGIATHGNEIPPEIPSVYTCLIKEKNNGILEIKNMLINMLNVSSQKSIPAVVISERHKQTLTEVLSALKTASSLINTEYDMQVIAAQHIRKACNKLGELLGTTYTEDLLDKIFSKFCLGK